MTLKNENAIFAVWKRIKIDHNYKNKEHEKLVIQYPIPYDKDYFISLFPDGKGAISYKTELDSILWIGQNDKEILIPDSGIMYYKSEKIWLIESNKDTLLKVLGEGGFVEMTFNKYSNLTSNYKEDPNYP